MLFSIKGFQWRVLYSLLLLIKNSFIKKTKSEHIILYFCGQVKTLYIRLNCLILIGVDSILQVNFQLNIPCVRCRLLREEFESIHEGEC